MPTANFRQLPDLSLFSGNGTNASFLRHLPARRERRHRQQHQLLRFEFALQRFPGSRRHFRSRSRLRRHYGLVNQKTGQRQGNANFVLYQLYKNSSASTICPSSATPA